MSFFSKDFDMSKVVVASTGMDSFLSDETVETVELFSRHPTESFRVASVESLKGFTRVANTNTLIRTCEQDLWTLKEGEDGTFFVERLFDDDGNPLKA
jgi:hypothetical protein